LTIGPELIYSTCTKRLFSVSDKQYYLAEAVLRAGCTSTMSFISQGSTIHVVFWCGRGKISSQTFGG